MSPYASESEPAWVGGSVAAAGPNVVSLSSPRHYVSRMVAFLVVFAAVVLLVHEHVYRFFLRNPPLNALILSVLAIGIVLAFRAVLSLEPEVEWAQRFRRKQAGPLEAPPPLLASVAAVLRDSKGHLALSTTGVRSILDGVDSRLDERRETLRYLIALLIFLGLLGTFWGLLMTANSVGETIRSLNVTGSDPAEMFETLRAGLEAPLSGMGTAFSTSLFGLAASLILGFLDLQASQAQNRFANEVETWLTSLARHDVAAGGEAPAPSYLFALLEKTAESFDELRGRMDRDSEQAALVNASLHGIGERLAGVADQLRTRSSETVAAAQPETLALLHRIAAAIEARPAVRDETLHTHLRSIDLALGRLLDETPREREHAVSEIRNEIRLLARTLSVIADRER